MTAVPVPPLTDADLTEIEARATRAPWLRRGEVTDALTYVAFSDVPRLAASLRAARAELERFRSNAEILSASTIGEAFDRIEEIIAERDQAQAELAQFRASAVEVFAADNGPAGIIPISASDAAAIKSPANRALLLHAYRTPWRPLQEGADRG